MSATDQDVRALEHIALRLRQDTHGAGPWDPHGTHIAFADYLKGMHLPTAVELVLHHACDPEAKTPAAIKRPFRPELPKPDGRWEPPKRAEECDLHPGQRATNCGGCAADRLAGDETPVQRPRPVTEPPAEYRAAREALHAAQASTETEEDES